MNGKTKKKKKKKKSFSSCLYSLVFCFSSEITTKVTTMFRVSPLPAVLYMKQLSVA